MKMLQLPRWGPKKLREIIDLIESAINSRTPLEGEGISVEDGTGGRVIRTKLVTTRGEDGTRANPSGAANSGGSSTVIATEFETSANAGTDAEEILYSHGIGAKRLVNVGDSIRATYGVYINNTDAASRIRVRFGAEGDDGALNIAAADDFNGGGDIIATDIEIRLLIIRSGNNTFRIVSTVAGSGSIGGSFHKTRVNFSGGDDGNVSSWEDNQFLMLCVKTSGAGAAAGDILALSALIEYIPA